MARAKNVDEGTGPGGRAEMGLPPAGRITICCFRQQSR
jgi:hypothetical protein